jgi:hypothetical protein
MAILLFLLAIAGGVLVGDLVLENTAAGSVTVLDRTFTGYTEGQLLAVVAALGFVVGVLVVASVSLRRTRRARRRELRTAERELTAQLTELERENLSLRKQLAHRDPSSRRRDAGGMPADLVTGLTASAGERPPRSPAPPADPRHEPVYEEARRVARLRSSDLER